MSQTISPQAPPTLPDRPVADVRRHPALVAWGVRLVVLVALVVLAAWTATRRPALAEAIAAEARGETRTALRRALDHLARNPADREANLVAARGLSSLLYADEAEAFYDAARRSGPLALPDLQARALGLTRSDRDDEAVAAYEAILRESPDDPVALRSLATVEWLRGDVNRAIALADRLARTPAGAVAGAAVLGSFYLEARKPLQAAAAYRRAHSLDPQLRAVPMPADLFWTDFGEVLLVTGQAAEARRYLLASPLTPRTPALLDLLGQAYAQEGDFHGAERTWLRSGEVDPTRAAPWKSLGRLALRQRRPEEAAAYLEQAAGLAPDDYEVAASLGAALRQLGRDAEAATILERADALRRAMAPPTGGMGASPSSAPGANPTSADRELPPAGEAPTGLPAGIEGGGERPKP